MVADGCLMRVDDVLCLAAIEQVEARRVDEQRGSGVAVAVFVECHGLFGRLSGSGLWANVIGGREFEFVTDERGVVSSVVVGVAAQDVEGDAAEEFP